MKYYNWIHIYSRPNFKKYNIYNDIFVFYIALKYLNNDDLLSKILFEKKIIIKVFIFIFLSAKNK